MADKLFAECEEAEKDSPLPDKIDRNAFSKLITNFYLRAWVEEPID